MFKTTLEDWKKLNRILCVRLDSMGDVLMTEPVIRAMKESNPRAHLTLLTSPSGAEAARLLPCVDEVIVYDAPWMKASPKREESSIDQAFISSLRSRGFDAAVIFTVYSQNPLPAALFCYLAEIPRRLAHCRENPYHLLTDWVKEVEPERTVRHEVRRQLELVASVGCYVSDERMRLQVSNAATARVSHLLAAWGIKEGDPFLVVHPGASAVSRRYPPESFAMAIRGLHHKMRWPVLVTGTEDELALTDEIIELAQVPCYSVVGELTLEELGALLQRSSLLLSNNTGTVHVAAAVRSPVVDLYALTNPQHTPWAVPSKVLFRDVSCRYCYKSACPEGHNNCLKLVTPEEVVASSLALLEELGLKEREGRAFERIREWMHIPKKLPRLSPGLPGVGAQSLKLPMPVSGEII